MAVSIQPRELTSVQLNVCTIVFPAKEYVTCKIGTKKYLIVGDGVTEAKDLPRLYLGLSKLSDLEADNIIPWRG